jgi:hypothetical protein
MATDSNKNSGQSSEKPVKIPTDRPVFTPTSKLEIKGLKDIKENATQKPSEKG